MNIFAWLAGLLGFYGWAQTIFSFVAELVVIGGATIFTIKIIYRKERRFIENVSRIFTFFSLSSGTNLDTELGMIKRSGIFNCPEKIETDPRCFDTLPADQGLFILAVDERTNQGLFQTIYTKIQNAHKPVIIYTGGNRNIGWLNDASLHNYSYYTIATSPLRLVSDIFTILSTHADK
jgi:hypothetical protein